VKVLHVISSGGMYGAEAVILNLLRTMRDGPHEAALGIFDNAANPNRQFYEAAVREGFRLKLIGCSGQVDRATVRRIRELAAAERADVIHAHGYKADIYCWLAVRGRVPLVSTCHTWYDTDLMVTLYGKADRLVLRSFQRVVSVSDEVTQRLLGAGVRRERVRLVRNGIDLRRFEGGKDGVGAEGEVVVGLVGRLAWEKGVDVFLAAASQLVREFPRAKFVVAGEGPDAERLERMLDQLKIRGRAELLGRREDMPALYRSLDIMVSASRQEGLPMAILEGMASGLPMVATRVGEVPTVVRDGVTGFVVEPGDAGALAEAMAKLLGDPALRWRFGEAGRETIEAEYSAARMTAEYLRVYEEAIAEARR
jgi:glycosyltransferase involved in cell wall biosynthesis